MAWTRFIFRVAGFSIFMAIPVTLCGGCFGRGVDDNVKGRGVDNDVERRGVDNDVEDAVISADGKYFAQSTGFGTTIYEVQTGKVWKELNEAAASILRFSSDSKYMASRQLNELTLWELAGPRTLVSWKGSNGVSYRIDFSPDGSLLAMSDDKSIRIWEISTQKLSLTIPLRSERTSLAFSPDGKYIAAAATEVKADEPRFHEIGIWQVSSGKLDMVLRGPYCTVESLAFSPDGRYLATALSTAFCQVWDLRIKKELWNKKVGNVDYGILTFLPGGERLAVGGYQTINVFDLAKGTLIKTHKIPGSRITSLTARAEQGHLVLSKANSVCMINLTSGEQRVLFPKGKSVERAEKSAMLK